MAIVGAGPAGAAAAAALAGRRTVVLIDRLAEPADRIGETLPGAARRLLEKLGGWDRFAAAGHAPCYARRSVWGAAEPVELDSIADPAGPAWRLDRRAFDGALRDLAGERGAELVAPESIVAINGEAGAWRLRLESGAELRSALVLDAGGRASRLLRKVCGRPLAGDRLVCAWTHLPLNRSPAEITYVEACPDGWWYSAPLPTGRRVLAFHTDADLTSAAELAQRLRDGPAAHPQLLAELADSDFASASDIRICVAGSARSSRVAGDGWLLAGDAAMAFDPLSSQGLFNALYTGLLAARAAELMVAGDASATTAYAGRIGEIWSAYERHLEFFYAEERRWPESAFWARRLR